MKPFTAELFSRKKLREKVCHACSINDVLWTILFLRVENMHCIQKYIINHWTLLWKSVQTYHVDVICIVKMTKISSVYFYHYLNKTYAHYVRSIDRSEKYWAMSFQIPNLKYLKIMFIAKRSYVWIKTMKQYTVYI